MLMSIENEVLRVGRWMHKTDKWFRDGQDPQTAVVKGWNLDIILFIVAAA